MTWVRIDENFATHPKVLQAGPLAMAMHVAALCYCNKFLTDGFVPRQVVPTLVNLEGLGMRMWQGECFGGGEDARWELVVEDLVTAGLWEEADGGWQIHDYHDYQPSKEDVLRERQQKSEAGRKGAQARWQELKQRDNTSHGTCHSTCHSRAMAEPMAKSCPGPVSVPNIDKDIETPPYSPPAVDNPESEAPAAAEGGEDDLFLGLMRTVGDRDIGLDQEAFDGLVTAMKARGMPVEVAEVAADLTLELCREPAARGAYFQRVIGSWLERGIVTIPAAERDAERARQKAKLRAGPVSARARP